MKPADEPCPKCGGKDVQLKYTRPGERVPFLAENAKPFTRSFDERAYDGITDWRAVRQATEEHILHTCRCGYVWCGPCHKAQPFA